MTRQSALNGQKCLKMANLGHLGPYGTRNAPKDRNVLPVGPSAPKSLAPKALIVGTCPFSDLELYVTSFRNNSKNFKNWSVTKSAKLCKHIKVKMAF